MTTNITASQVLDKASGQVGYQEGYSNGHWNNNEKFAGQVPGLEWANGQAWCATFVSWCFLKAGMPKNSYPTTASVWSAMQWWKGQNRWSEYPAVGAQVIYGATGNSHTGIVYAYDSNYIYAYEGNTNTTGSAEGDGVYKKKRLRRDSYVHGYGYPDYKGGIVSADPSWKKPVTPTPNKPTPAKPTPPSSQKVSLKNLQAAAKADPSAAQGHTTHAADVKIVEAALKAEGLLDAKYASDGSYGTTTITAMSKWQKAYSKANKLGWSGSDVDGKPGKTSLTALGKKHGFTVSA